MILEYSRQLIAIAVILLLLGCIMPFLMVISVVESTIFLNFFSFGASVLGLFLGVAGIAGEKIKKEK
jgi:hypothetical protein